MVVHEGMQPSPLAAYEQSAATVVSAAALVTPSLREARELVGAGLGPDWTKRAAGIWSGEGQRATGESGNLLAVQLLLYLSKAMHF